MMPCHLARRLVFLLTAACTFTALPRDVTAQDRAEADVGRIKVVRGTVHVERQGQRLPGQVGLGIRASDVIVTGLDGTAGIAFLDQSLLSVGPDTVLAIDRFVFDTTTHEGALDSALRRGTLAGVSGQIAKQAPGAMRVRTPVAILGVRGTEFLVRTAE
jgi:hypothetical protein